MCLPHLLWLHLPLDLNNPGFLDRSILLTKDIVDPARAAGSISQFLISSLHLPFLILRTYV